MRSPNNILDLLKKTRANVVKFIPKASRRHFAKLLKDCLCEVVASPEDKFNWVRLFRAATSCLHQPDRGGTRKRKSLATILNQQIQEFENEDKDRLLVAGNRISEKTMKRKSDPADNTGRKISEKIDEGDVRGGVRLASSDATIAPFDSTTLKKLESKHPETPLVRRVYPQNVNTTLIFNEDDVYRAVMSFAPGSAGGTTCLRPQHVKDCLSDKLGQDASNLKSALTEFVNLLLSGKVPDRIKPIIAGANLSAFNKPNGGLRPIAVGDTLRRVAGKCAASIASSKFKSYFAPLQVGLGIRGGAEAAVHALRAFIKSANENDVLLKLDFSNAFNAVRRDYVAELLAEEMPELLPFYRLCYEQGSFLSFGEGFIVSEEGFQQGDPLAVFLFCLSIHRFIVRLKARLKIAYIDDITKGDDWKIVIGDLRLVMAEIQKVGLSLNDEKCEIVFFSSNHEFRNKVTNEFKLLCPRIKTVQDSEIELLGSALGPISIETIFNQKLKAILLMKERLKHVSSHCALFLLKNCFLIPKLMYFFRTSEV